MARSRKRLSSPNSPELTVTISGKPGSGKSLVASMVANALGIDHVSAGDFMRQMAEERGISILELSRIAEGDQAVDHEIDARSARFASDGGPFVLDARLGWHFVPGSFKVFLDVRPEVAASRIFGAGRHSERENTDVTATLAAIAARSESERQRYLEYYDIDYLDQAHYDLVIDTSDLAPEAVTRLILDRLPTRSST